MNQLFAPLTKNAPTIGPISVRAAADRGPDRDLDASRPGDISPGLMMPTCGTYSAPATPHITAESVQIVSL